MNNVWMDRLGGLASTACATHCLAFALIPTVLSVFGLNVLAHEAFEWGLFALAIGFAIAAGVLCYRNRRASWLLAGFCVGVLVLMAGRISEALSLFEGGGVLAVLGGGLLAISHVVSLRQTQQQVCCP